MRHEVSSLIREQSLRIFSCSNFLTRGGGRPCIAEMHLAVLGLLSLVHIHLQVDLGLDYGRGDGVLVRIRDILLSKLLVRCYRRRQLRSFDALCAVPIAPVSADVGVVCLRRRLQRGAAVFLRLALAFADTGLRTGNVGHG